MHKKTIGKLQNNYRIGENMIKGAIFDVDGTILDSMKIWDEAGGRYLAALGLKAEENLHKTLFSMTIEEGAEYMKDRYGIRKSTEEISKGLLDVVRDFYFYEAMPKAGAAEVLELFKSKNLPMTVATSSDKEHIERAFERLGIKDCFMRIFTCSELGAGKTEPLIFEKAAELMGTSAENTYVLEDGLYAAETAKRAGFKTIGIYDDSSADDWEQLKSTVDFAVRDLREFNKIWEFISK